MHDTQDTRQLIEDKLTEALAPAHLVVIDNSAAHAGHEGARMSGGGHFNILIVAEAFEDKMLIDQHKLVHQAVGYPMDGRIHALEIKTVKPSRWSG